MTAPTPDADIEIVGPQAAAARTPLRWLPGGHAVRWAGRIVERNTVAYKRLWGAYATGLLEPLFFLFSIGLGVGALVGDIETPVGSVPYDVFVAPGLLAASAMNGATLDTTFNFFVKFKYIRTYDGMLATPLRPPDIAAGEVLWSLLRGGIYGAAFLATMVVMGLVLSWWAVLALPAAVLIGFAFAGAGLGASTYMRSWLDFDFINLVILPLFLFSATFFPISEYPPALQWVVRVSPLYQGVALERSLILGEIRWSLLVNVVYLAMMGTIGLWVAGRRLAKLLQP